MAQQAATSATRPTCSAEARGTTSPALRADPATASRTAARSPDGGVAGAAIWPGVRPPAWSSAAACSIRAARSGSSRPASDGSPVTAATTSAASDRAASASASRASEASSVRVVALEQPASGTVAATAAAVAST